MKDQSIAILLNVCPYHSALINDIATEFGLSDLQGPLHDFCAAQLYGQHLGQQYSSPDCALPFECLNVWTNFCLQQHSVQDPCIISPHQTVQAMPTTNDLPGGQCNTVLVYNNDGYHISLADSGLCLTQVSSLFWFLTPFCKDVKWFKSILYSNQLQLKKPPILLYSDFFRFSPDHTVTANGIDMFICLWHHWGDGHWMGDIVWLDTVTQVVELVPQLGTMTDRLITCNTSLDSNLTGEAFHLNHFATKENFHAILSYNGISYVHISKCVYVAIATHIRKIETRIAKQAFPHLCILMAAHFSDHSSWTKILLECPYWQSGSETRRIIGWRWVSHCDPVGSTCGT